MLQRFRRDDRTRPALQEIIAMTRKWIALSLVVAALGDLCRRAAIAGRRRRSARENDAALASWEAEGGAVTAHLDAGLAPRRRAG
jgi:hypothetical protein